MSAERVFTALELERFLRAVDAHLEEPRAIVLIGGSAAAIAHRVDAGTTDVDLFESNDQALKDAFEQARKATGLPIPVSQPAAADLPYNAEERYERVLSDLLRLTVFALEKHDLALSKAARGQQNDFDALKKLHELSPLDAETLISRYLAEMEHAIGNVRQRDYSFLMLITHLFDEIAHVRAERRVTAYRQAQIRARSKP